MQAKLRNFYDHFGSRISFLREKRGLTLGQLADGAASTAKSWEEGSLPRADQWESIAKRLGLSVSFVFLGKPVSREDFGFIAKFTDEIGSPPVSWELHEDPAPSGSEARGSENAPEMRKPATKFLHRPGPIGRQQLEAYLHEYLNLAELVPGGIEHAYIELTDALPLEKMRRRVEAEGKDKP